MDFSLCRSFAELEGQAGEWNRLLAESSAHLPFLRHEYQAAWWSTRGGGEWPAAELALVLATGQGRLAGIAPLFFARNRDGQPALLLLGSIEISDYLDVICRPADLDEFVSGLVDFLDSCPALPAWKLLDWHNVNEDSPTLPLLEAQAARRGWSFTRERTYHAPSIPLRGDFEAYLSGIDKKQRHEIRRKMRRAEESGRGVRWYIVQDAGTLADEVDAFLALMAQDPQKDSFLTPAMREQMQLACRAAFENGWLQLAFLEADGQKAAAYLNFDYLNQIWVYNSGIDRRFMDLSAGWVLLGYLLRWANENQRAEFDFLRGDEDYKYRFGALDRYLVRARLAR
jgi:CelD/BcsL family acetyltransferase involved in cellulose biosynthesis